MDFHEPTAVRLSKSLPHFWFCTSLQTMIDPTWVSFFQESVSWEEQSWLEAVVRGRTIIGRVVF